MVIPLERGGSSAVVRGRAGRPADRPYHDQQHCYHNAPKVKPEAAAAIVELLMMDVRTPETCWAVHTSKRQAINLKNCCIWLVDLFENLHVSDSSSVHHQEFFTVHTAMVYVINVCWQLASRIRMQQEFHSDPARKQSANLYDIYHCCVYTEKLLMMDRGTARNM